MHPCSMASYLFTPVACVMGKCLDETQFAVEGT